MRVHLLFARASTVEAMRVFPLNYILFMPDDMVDTYCMGSEPYHWERP